MKKTIITDYLSLVAEEKYLLILYKKFGLFWTVILVSSFAFLLGLTIIVPMNIIMGGRFMTGIVINLIICSTFIPYHLYCIIKLLSELDALRESNYQQSIRDELTQAYNRRYFLNVIESMKNSTHEIPPNTSLIMIDLDDLKLINDQYGHTMGDFVLKSFSENCRAVLRTTDFFVRFGGDEFICLLPNTKSEKAKDIANRILENISKVETFEDKDDIFFTASIGVATAITQTHIHQLIEVADQALYDAKVKGKHNISIRLV